MLILLRFGILAFALAATSGIATAASTTPALVIHIKNYAFVPAPLSVHTGDTVTFINDDDEAHTVIANDKSFSSQGLDTGNSWKHTFSKAGTFAYFCGLHPYMKGTITVSTVPAQ